MYYFASDIHLGLQIGSDPENRERLLVQWLDEVSKDADAIFLVGDIFDFWYEYRYVVPKGFTRLLGKIPRPKKWNAVRLGKFHRGLSILISEVLLLVLMIKRTKTGMAMRAVSRDFETSELMGIKINNVISMTFVIGCFLAAIGSLLYFTNYNSVIPTSGAMPGLKAFVAAVFGGIGSVPGAVIGAFIIGICENIIKGLGLTEFSDAFTFVLLIVILLVKPTGIFGEKSTDKV
mgnify:CR=1 FL=1